MKKLIFVFAITSMFALAAFAQTPTPPPARTTTAAPASSAPAGSAAGAPTGGTGAEGKLVYINIGKFGTDISELKVKIDALNNEFESKKKEVQAEEDALNNLKTKINNQGGTVMVLEGGAAQQAGILIFAAQNSDITDDFIKEYNKANPAGGGAAAPTPKKP